MKDIQIHAMCRAGAQQDGARKPAAPKGARTQQPRITQQPPGVTGQDVAGLFAGSGGALNGGSDGRGAGQWQREGGGGGNARVGGNTEPSGGAGRGGDARSRGSCRGSGGGLPAAKKVPRRAMKRMYGGEDLQAPPPPLQPRDDDAHLLVDF